MRVLVTGGGGFVGSGVVRALQRAGHEVDAPRRHQLNLTNRDMLLGYLSVPPDAVVNCAGTHSVREPGRCMEDNALAACHLAAACSSYSLRLVHVSSATVYGSSKASFYEHSPRRPESEYALSKCLAEEAVEYHRARGLDAVIVRPVAVVGPGATHGLLPDVRRKLLGPSTLLELIGRRPGTVKPFVHVDDLGDFICSLLVQKSPDRAYNCAGDGELSVEQVAEIAMQLTGVVKPVRWLGGGWEGDQARLKVTCSAPKFGTSEEAVRRALSDG